MDDDELTQEVYMKEFYRIAGECMHPQNKASGIELSNPDLALFVYCQLSRSSAHILQFDEKRPIKIARVQSFHPLKEGEKKQVGTGQYYINFSSKYSQPFPFTEQVYGLKQVTPFCACLFTKYGPTVETGLDGSRGKTIKNIRIPRGEEKYEITLTNENYHPSMMDSDWNHPVATEFFNMHTKQSMRILRSLLANPLTLTDLRKDVAEKQIAYNTNDELFTIVNNQFFKGKLSLTENIEDKTSKWLSISVSCYRPLHKEHDANYVYPTATDMFVTKKTSNTSDKPIGQNKIKVVRCRRANECVAGETYDSPFILIPEENAVITSEDVISVVYTKNFYEWKFDKCGVTNKQVLIIWLNTKRAIKAMRASDIERCNPRYAIPMAGYYKGPLGYEGAPPPSETAVAVIPDPVVQQFAAEAEGVAAFFGEPVVSKE